mmetsp:Transcript_68050/g.114343  ORF Transcript_68050/g.114343 Transcript_68050/m.114343 type:complete len:270 (+) Transcript_68050:428-1237(+)
MICPLHHARSPMAVALDNAGVMPPIGALCPAHMTRGRSEFVAQPVRVIIVGPRCRQVAPAERNPRPVVAVVPVDREVARNAEDGVDRGPAHAGRHVGLQVAPLRGDQALGLGEVEVVPQAAAGGREPPNLAGLADPVVVPHDGDVVGPGVPDRRVKVVGGQGVRGGAHSRGRVPGTPAEVVAVGGVDVHGQGPLPGPTAHPEVRPLISRSISDNNQRLSGVFEAAAAGGPPGGEVGVGVDVVHAHTSIVLQTLGRARRCRAAVLVALDV